MATAEQLIQQVRFALETLRERNGHHEFEMICLGVARRRIASNLLPATGPVSSGGDQGRDAESHWTNLPNEIGTSSAFARLATTEDVVLACTMQCDNVPSKIRHDLQSICGSGQSVARVVYFTVTPVEISKRHELQEEAQGNHRVMLDVWDSQALAQALAEPDLFYLAVQYLHVPSELAPPSPEEEGALPAWYVADRARWRVRTDPARTFGELVDLRGPLRYATFHAEARPDLADWLSHARAMLAAATERDVGLHCRYEIAVATLRGTNTLRPADDLVRAFYAAVLDEDVDAGLLEDAAVLGQYCFGALGRGLTELTAAELITWHGRLRAKVRTLLSADPFPNGEAHLLALSARLALYRSFTARPDIDVEQLLPTPLEATEYVMEMLDADEPVEVYVFDLEFVDLDGGMADLQLLCQRLPGAPMFPVENIADYFDLLAPCLAGHASYREVRDALDDAMERVYGESARASRARTRGMRFLAADRLLDALAEIHDAKVNWWHGETLYGAVLAMLLASHIYSRLQLPLAAKQYALIAAVGANASNQPDLAIFLPRGLALAATYDYQAGNWLTATHTFQVATLAQSAVAEEPWDLERHEEFSTMVTYQSIILKTARDLRPELTNQIQTTLQSTGMNAMVEPILNGVADQPNWSEEKWARIADEDGGGRPFSDAGPTRRYTWNALGMTWTVTATNERAAALAAERFAAAAQIVIAELATDDAVLLGGQVHVEVRPDCDTLSSGTAPCESVPDNEASRWIVHLTPANQLDINEFHQELASALFYIIATNSLLPYDQFKAVIDRAFERGLWHKLAMGRPYDEAADLLKPDGYHAMAQAPDNPIGNEIPAHPAPADELRPSTQPGPGYDRHASLELVRGRYQNAAPIAQYTLPRILTNAGFRATIRKLRDEGWLDWHLLIAIANYLANRRLEWEGVYLPPPNQAAAAHAFEVMQRPERADDPQVPAEDFSEDALHFSLHNAAMSTVKVLGLQSHQDTPDFGAILAILGARYGYWTDDVDHDNLFGWP